MVKDQYDALFKYINKEDFRGLIENLTRNKDEWNDEIDDLFNYIFELSCLTEKVGCDLGFLSLKIYGYKFSLLSGQGVQRWIEDENGNCVASN